MDNDRCETCRHFYTETEIGDGLCRRFPPQLSFTGWAFPAMQRHGLCGEYSYDAEVDSTGEVK